MAWGEVSPGEEWLGSDLQPAEFPVGSLEESAKLMKIPESSFK